MVLAQHGENRLDKGPVKALAPGIGEVPTPFIGVAQLAELTPSLTMGARPLPVVGAEGQQSWGPIVGPALLKACRLNDEDGLVCSD